MLLLTGSILGVMDDRIGRLFPAGGPVPPDLVIGRAGDIEEIVRRSREAIHTMLTGPRRIGKTTVCSAVCERLAQEDVVVVEVEVPERTDAKDLLQLVVDRCNRISRTAAMRGLLRVARPLIEQTLAAEGIPLDLGQLTAQAGGLPTRKILALPLALAEERGRPVVFFLDELQRAVDYADGEQLLGDLVDLYSGNPTWSCSSTAAMSGRSMGCSPGPCNSASSSIDWSSTRGFPSIPGDPASQSASAK